MILASEKLDRINRIYWIHVCSRSQPNEVRLAKLTLLLGNVKEREII
jgi:hypothetical protein